jgi:hypothetical protein
LVWIGKTGDHGLLASHTDAGLYMAAVTISRERHDEVRRDRAAALATGLRGWPELGACLASARRIGPVRMLSRWHGFFRRSAGPGWALVGDAGHFKDPSPGQGIADALRQTAALAPTVVTALGGRRDPDAVLRDWWRWRDRDAREMYWFAQDMGAAGVTRPLRRELQEMVATDPALVGEFVRILNHDVAPSTVLGPGLALRGTARALRAGNGRPGALLREAAGLVATEAGRQARWSAAVLSAGL